MDLRRAPRILIHCPVMLIGEYLLGEGSVTNLSLSGCGVKSSTKMHRGTYMELRLLVQVCDRPISVDVARVRWTKESYLGLEFIQVGVEHQQELARIVTSFQGVPRS